MPHELKIFAGNSHLDFSRGVAKILNRPLHEPSMEDRKGKMVTWFSNQNVLVDIKTHVRGEHCFVIQTQAPNVSEHIIELLWMVNALRTSKAKSVIAVMPYMPYIRSDKKDHPRACIGAKLFAQLLETAGVTGVLIMDPHFDQIHGFFNEINTNVDVLRSKPIFAHYIRANYDLSNAVVVAADAGGTKRAASQVNLLELSMAVIDKKRKDDSEDPIPSGIVGDVSGKDAFIFEDESASLKTILKSAAYLKEVCGVRSVRACVTHPVLSVLSAIKKMHEGTHVDQMIVCNTIPVPPEKQNDKIVVIPVEEYFARAIDLIYRGESVDEYKHNLYQGLPNTESITVY